MKYYHIIITISLYKKNHFLVTKYKDVKVEQPKKSAPNVVSSNPLDNLDCEYCNLCYYIIVINKLCCFIMYSKILYYLQLLYI